MEYVEIIAQALPVLQEAMGVEVMLVVVDASKKVRAYRKSTKLDTGYRIGQMIAVNDEVLQKALRGIRNEQIIPKAVYGMEFKGYAFPLKEQHKVVGAVGVAIPAEGQRMLERYMNSMNEIILGLHNKVQVIGAHSEQLTITTQKINEQANQVSEDAQHSNGITDLIKTISNQTNLLGLNASIEAARAGEQGKGFNIVAQEVRKLSMETSDATENIELSLRNINRNVEVLRNSLVQINSATAEQVQLVEDFTEIIENLRKLSDEMQHILAN